MKKSIIPVSVALATVCTGCTSGTNSSEAIETTAENTTVVSGTTEVSTEATTIIETTAVSSETEPVETTLFHIENHGKLYDQYFLPYADKIQVTTYEEYKAFVDNSIDANFSYNFDYYAGSDLVPENYTIEITDDYGDLLHVLFADGGTGVCTLSMLSYTRTAHEREVSISDSLHFVDIGYWKIETKDNSQTPAKTVEELGDWVFQLDLIS